MQRCESQEKFNKTFSKQWGRGPAGQRAQAATNPPVLDTVRGLPAFPQIFEVWLQQRGNNAEAPLKWRGEQTEAGWLQCLSKVLIKPHSPSPTETKLNKQRLAGAHFLSSSPTAPPAPPCSRYPFVIRGFRLTRQQRGNSTRSHKVICAHSEGGSVSLWTQ